MEVHRVRTLLRYLPNMGELQKDKIIPGTALFPTFKKGGNLNNQMANTVGYSVFGLYVEKIIALSITNDPLSPEELLQLLSEAKFFKTKPLVYNEVISMTRDHFKDKSDIKFNYELLSMPIAGHPDIISSDTVYDVKTAFQWNRMRKDTTYQLLSYYALARKLGMNNITHIGLILPVQKSIVRIKMDKWDWKPFYDKLLETITLKANREKLYVCNTFDAFEFELLKRAVVGNTLSRSKKFLDMFYYIINDTKPFQFFIAGQNSYSLEMAANIKDKIRYALTKPNAVKGYIHSSYAFKLSNPWSDRRDGEEVPVLYRKWQKLMELSIYMNISGVVIHTGQTCESNKNRAMTVDVALENMRNSVIEMAKFSTPKCKMLIESPAGQSGELLPSPEELASFYISLDDATKTHVALCVDTCHVFSAGYDPMEYINIIEDLGVPIELIHYNDSELPKGSHRDRHAAIPIVYPDINGMPVIKSYGYIGVEKLACVLNWAVERGISCVHE